MSGEKVFQTVRTASEDTLKQKELVGFEKQKEALSFRMLAVERKRSPNSKDHQQEKDFVVSYKEAWRPCRPGSKVG